MDISRRCRKPTLVALVALLLVTTTGESAHAIFDHLLCYPFQAPRSAWSVGASVQEPFRVMPRRGFETEEACTLLPKRRPVPKQYCVPSSTPGSSGGVTGRELERGLLCYDAKCEGRPANAEIRGRDRFGGGSGVVKSRPRRRRLCVPAARCHDPCETGEPLDPVCGPDVEAVCSLLPRCCVDAWTDFCVSLVEDFAGASCPVPTSCRRATVTVGVSFTASDQPTAGIATFLAYDRTKVDMPDDEVDSRVVNLTGFSHGLFQVSDFETPTDASVNASLVVIPGDIRPGPITSASFDCVDGEIPQIADFECASEVSDLLGTSLDASCSVSVELE